MGFYELGSGCDSCATVDTILPNNVNMQMDPNSSLVANMVMPYGTQLNPAKQYNNAISSGYTTNGSNMGMMGTGSNGNPLGGQIAVVMPTAQQQGQQQQKPSTSVPVTVVVPSANSKPQVPSNSNKVEGFTDGVAHAMNDKKWIVLGLVIFSALAGNECCKYFLNKSLQLNDGSPLYYVAYAAVAILLTYAAYTYACKN
jgi:hypothetical protein